jgi:hypothetical protein
MSEKGATKLMRNDRPKAVKARPTPPEKPTSP